MARQMGSITVAAVGKLRHRHWRPHQEDYLERLQRYTAVTLVEVKDVVGKGFPDAVAMEREGDALLQATEGAARRVLVTEKGRLLTSRGLATFLRKQIEIYGHIAFLIGGPLGFAQPVVDAAPEQLSLSPLTLTHEMARVLLLEQLYRAFTIINGEQYHK